MNWETADAVGSLLGGVFSGLAFAATLFLISREARIRRADSAAEAARTADENARQARLIVSEITEESYPLNHAFDIAEIAGTVWNHSRMPIFNLVVAVPALGSGQEGIRIVMPGATADVQMRVQVTAPKPLDGRAVQKEGLTLHFLDAHGRHWKRVGAGQPERVLKDPLSAKVPVERFKPDDNRS